MKSSTKYPHTGVFHTQLSDQNVDFQMIEFLNVHTHQDRSRMQKTEQRKFAEGIEYTFDCREK